ncbi:MAG TPA: Crp/Fnr family transcriptional regulator [Reyranella sp.]|nr:Crp/Fnr family transcriptional regulator [Reyranella sp.]
MDVFPLPRVKGSPPVRNRRPPALDRVGTPRVLAADTVLYREGEAADSLYYLESGAVMVGVAAAEAEPIIVAVHGPGAFFGARSLRPEPHKTTASALVPSTVVAVARTDVESLLRTDAAFARQFAVQMMRRAAALEEEQVDRVVNSLDKRLARALLILASVDAESDEARVLERMTDSRLAHMLAADPARIRELLHEFRQAGHIGANDPLSVRSSLVRVLLPAHLADQPGPLEGLGGLSR